ncbi:MAG: hypothetical protein RIQ45_990, partial [Actinomycetota bacterium]
DLINWEHLSDFHSPEITEIYECPDLFPLGEKWVLIISTNPGGLYGGSGSQYLIGQFNGKEFIPETKAEFLDYGPDYYAAVTFNDSPERISIGWMNNWLYANDRKLEIWNGAMSAARKLKIENGKLIQTFIDETENFHTDANEFEFKYSNGSLKFKRSNNQLIVDRSELWDSEITTFSIPTACPVTLKALFDAGSIELEVNGYMATALINVGEETPLFRLI